MIALHPVLKVNTMSGATAISMHEEISMSTEEYNWKGNWKRTGFSDDIVVQYMTDSANPNSRLLVSEKI